VAILKKCLLHLRNVSIA